MGTEGQDLLRQAVGGLLAEHVPALPEEHKAVDTISGDVPQYRTRPPVQQLVQVGQLQFLHLQHRIGVGVEGFRGGQGLGPGLPRGPRVGARAWSTRGTA